MSRTTRFWGSKRGLFFYLFLAFYLLITVAFLLQGLGALVASASESLHDSFHLRGLGTGFFDRAALRMADGSHRLLPGAQVALDYTFSLFNLVLAGALIWLRPRDGTARLLALGMIGTAAVFNLQAVSVFEVLPRTPTVATGQAIYQLVAGGAYVFALLSFPDGTLIPRWPRWAKSALYGIPSVAVVGWFVSTRELASTTSTVQLIIFFGLITPVMAVIAQGYRMRRSPNLEEGQQARLLFWALIPALIVGLFVTTQGMRSFLSPGLEGRQLVQLPTLVFRIFQPVFALIPIALFVGLIRYRLWNVNRLITRTLVYTTLIGLILATYIGFVVGIGRIVGAGSNNVLLSILATAVVALAFEPAKTRLQKLADRLVFGKRATPYEVLSEFSERMSESYAPEVFLARMSRLLAEGTGATSASVWLRVGSQLRPEATWPRDPDEEPEPLHVSGDELPDIPGVTRAVPVRHQNELLGAMTLTKPQGESLTMTEEKLLGDVAGQAGLFLRNVRLTAELLQRLEELRASRQRLVTAQDEERRKLERNIHDGAQQQLIALKVSLSVADKVAQEQAPQLQLLLTKIKEQADEALENLRDLARGIYPPLLQAEGLDAAMQAQVRKVPLDVELICDGIGRHPEEVEGAIYFCCLEALQNITKYAGASRAKLRLALENGHLSFEVSDDGKGFDPDNTARGVGLQNMSDRVESLGGALEITSAPGRGTTVKGRVPLEQLHDH